jgi:hypothetical protein
LVLGGVLAVLMWWARDRWAPALAAWDVRRAASHQRAALLARFLGDAGAPGVGRAWATARTTRERSVAVHALAWVGSPRARDALVSAAAQGKVSASPEELRDALAALNAFEGPVTDMVLFAIAADATWPADSRVETAIILYERHRYARGPLLAVVAHEDSGALFYEPVARRMEAREDPALRDWLTAYVRHPHADVRTDALRRLHNWQERSSTPRDRNVWPNGARLRGSGRNGLRHPTWHLRQAPN